jgi:hypothetical protein
LNFRIKQKRFGWQHLVIFTDNFQRVSCDDLNSASIRSMFFH